MSERYPMTSLDEASASIRRAVEDRRALRISDDEFQAVRRELQRRILRIKKQALFSTVAKITRRELPQKNNPPPKGGRATQRA